MGLRCTTALFIVSKWGLVTARVQQVTVMLLSPLPHTGWKSCLRSIFPFSLSQTGHHHSTLPITSLRAEGYACIFLAKPQFFIRASLVQASCVCSLVTPLRLYSTQAGPLAAQVAHLFSPLHSSSVCPSTGGLKPHLITLQSKLTFSQHKLCP